MTKYPRVTSINVENFMAYEYAEAEFDDNNILNFKGYNASGKSALIKAFWVAFFNFKQKKQARWIKHGANQFVINIHFDDGFALQRGKLKNGKSWYILHNEVGEELYSTITDGIYEQVIDVPEVIKRYLGLSYNTKLNPHFLRSRDPLFLVDTTGSENYKYLSSALQGDELLKAVELAKAEQSQIKDSMSFVKHELEVYRDIYRQAQWLTHDLVTTLEALDDQLTQSEQLQVETQLLHNLLQDRSKLVVLPELSTVNQEMFNNVQSLHQLYTAKLEELTLQPLPNITGVQEGPQLLSSTLNTLYEYIAQNKKLHAVPTLDSVAVPHSFETLQALYQSIKDEKELPATMVELTTQPLPLSLLQALTTLDQLQTESTQLEAPVELTQAVTIPNDTLLGLSKLLDVAKEYNRELTNYKETEAEVQQAKQEQQGLFQTLKQEGYDMYECSCCGELNLVGVEHTHAS